MNIKPFKSESIAELARMNALCSLLGNPERSLCVIHVAGTNGKGSVCRYIYEALRAHGHTVGLFTSPHVRDVCERIEVDGEMIRAEHLKALTSRVLAAAKSLAREYPNTQMKGDALLEESASPGESSSPPGSNLPLGSNSPPEGNPPGENITQPEYTPPTEFEVLTAVAFLYFAEKMPDFVVVEAGLGGRRDATNVIQKPLVTVITQVGLDHTDRLGNTVEEIAWEKAGVIKTGCFVITGATKTAFEVIERVSNEKGAPLIDISEAEYVITQRSLGGYAFDVNMSSRQYRGVELAMAGEHQVINAVTALCVLDLLDNRRIVTIDDGALRQGFKNTHFDARFQIVSNDPLIIVDGAHNPDGARALTQTLGDLLPPGNLLFVCAFFEDKAVREIIRIFVRSASAFIAVGASYDRYLEAAALGEMLRLEGGVVLCEAASPKAAFEAALQKAEEFDAVIFAGSLYMAGDILQQAVAGIADYDC